MNPKKAIFVVVLLLLSSATYAVDIQTTTGNLTAEQIAVVNSIVQTWEDNLPSQTPEHIFILSFNNEDLGSKAQTMVAPGVELVLAGSGSRTPKRTTLASTSSFTEDGDDRPISSVIKINNNAVISWYTGLGATVPAGEFDLMSVLNHEVAHALGFTVNYTRFSRNVTAGPPRMYNSGGTPSGTLITGSTHLDSTVHPGDLMNSSISAATRINESQLDIDILLHDVWFYPKLVALLDRTGSMTTVRANGHTRCEDAVALLITDLNDFFTDHPDGEAAILTFANSSTNDLTGGFVDMTTALAVASGIDPAGCSGLTPLADAICTAVDTLPEVGLQASKILAISSDGEENNSSGACSGPDSTIGPPPPGNYDAGSWQLNAWTAIQDNAVTNVRYWGDVSRKKGGIDIETGLLVQQIVDDSIFFQDLAVSTGGTYVFMPDMLFQQQSIPSLNTTGIALLAVLLALAGALVIRWHARH